MLDEQLASTSADRLTLQSGFSTHKRKQYCLPSVYLTHADPWGQWASSTQPSMPQYPPLKARQSWPGSLQSAFDEQAAATPFRMASLPPAEPPPHAAKAMLISMSVVIANRSRARVFMGPQGSRSLPHRSA